MYSRSLCKDNVQRGETSESLLRRETLLSCLCWAVLLLYRNSSLTDATVSLFSSCKNKENRLFIPPPPPLTIGVGLQGPLHPLLGDVGPDVEVLELGVAAVQVDDQGVLLHNALLLFLLRLPRLVALLHLLDDAEGVLQVGGGHRWVAWRLQVGGTVRAGRARLEDKVVDESNF